MLWDHPSPFGRRWRARWIWAGRPAIRTETATRPVLDDPTDRVVLLRRSFGLAGVPATAPCRVWADGRYVLRVNGTEVARGPVRSDPRQAHYDVVDLVPHLRPGENVVALLARHFGAATSWWIPVPPSYSLGAGSVVLEARVGDGWVVSDRGWRAAPGEAWTPVPVPGDVACLPLESFDARRHPDGWDRPGFDDSDWARAIEIQPVHTGARSDPHPPSEPFGMLRPPVRSAFPGGAVHVAAEVASGVIAGAEPVADPVAQVLADEEHAGPPAAGVAGVVRTSFDLGRIAAGTVRLDLDAPAGTVFDLAAAEHVDAAGRLVPLGQHAGLRVVAAGGGPEAFESLEVIGTRHLHVSVRNPSPERPVTLAVAVADRHRPRPDGASFECSDPALNRIWEVGLRTVDLCALDAYVDCPTREQRAWTGDSVVHQMVDLVANPDWSMARWHPQLAAAPRGDGMLPMAAASDFAADDRTIVPDWSLHWVRSLWNLYRYTGDRELVAEYLPVAERTLRWFEPYLDGGLLRHVSGWLLLDWSSVYSDDCSSVLNALWARGLEDLAEMSQWVGNEGTAAWADRRRHEVAAAFELFWDDARGVYVDHAVGGVARPVAAQHGGAAALAAGLVPADRVARVVERLVDRSRLLRHSWVMDPLTVDGGSDGFVHLVMGYPEPEWDVHERMVEAQPFFRYVVHDGLARAGRADLIAGLCRDWQVFLDAGETTWPECWQGGTRCHGWSSTPTRDLVVHTLGISPAAPGYDAVRVAPALGDLEWARARVPTPHGFVTVEARADGTVEVDSPVPVAPG
ncbi:MAG: alpha-L-rhamnosidase C-terminal domain-containing protein [Microthrixaceae bacterium]